MGSLGETGTVLCRVVGLSETGSALCSLPVLGEAAGTRCGRPRRLATSVAIHP